MEINHLAVICAAISDLLIGALWFSPLLFFNSWKAEVSLSDEQLSKGQIKIFSLTLLMALIISYNLAAFLGEPNVTLAWAVTASLLAGVWAAASFVIVTLFERKSLRYILINVGYILVAFAVKGFIIGIWR